MSNSNSKIIRQYLKEVSEKLDCPKSVKTVFISGLTNDVKAFAADSEIADISELYGRFGTPEEISDGFMNRDDYKILLKKAKKNTYLWRVACAATAVLLVLVVILLVYIISDSASMITITDF